MRVIIKNILYLSLLICICFSENIDTLITKENHNKDSWKMSLLPFAYNIPSLGQFNNNKPMKGMSLMAMKAYWYKEFIKAKKDERISNRNRAFWWFMFLYFYSVIDAFIDPEMESFPKDEIQNEEVE